MRCKGRLSRSVVLQCLNTRAGYLFALLVACAVNPAIADSVQYSYDTLGRLVEAVDSTSSQAIEYSYDTIGNITSIQTVSTGALSVAGYSTDQAAPGSQITIYGTGFSTTPFGNTVTFNGMQGTVVSATSTQLVVTVPSGATAGPIRVATTTGGSTIGAPMSGFSPAGANPAPTITSFSPTVGAAGTAVAISGSFFQAGGLDNIVFNQSSASLTAATATRLTTAVPGDAASGPITVVTPYGTATSSSPFFVVPSGYSAGSVAATGTMTIGTAITVSLPTANTVAIETFSGTAGQYLTLGIASDSFASGTLQVYDPNGNLLVSGTISSSTTGLQLPQLPATGGYSIVLSPGANTGSVQLTLIPPLTGNSLSVGGSSLNLNLTPTGQRALVTFNGTQGQWLSLTVSSAVNIAATVLRSDGSQVFTGSTTPTNQALGVQFPQLPASDTYTIVVDPGNAGGSVTLSLINAVSATATPNPSNALVETLPNGASRGVVSFAATPGQYLSLAIQENTTCYSTGGACPPIGRNFISGLNITVYGPNGALLQTPAFLTNCNVSNTAPQQCFGDAVINLGLIPSNASGNYTVVVQQTGGINGDYGASLQFWLTYPYLYATGTLPINQATTFNAAYPGQGMLITFTPPSGQSLSLSVQETNQFIPVAQISVLNDLAAQVTLAATCGCDAFGHYSGSTTTLVGTLNPAQTWTILVQQQTQTSGNNNYGSLTGQLVFDLTPQ